MMIGWQDFVLSAILFSSMVQALPLDQAPGDSSQLPPGSTPPPSPPGTPPPPPGVQLPGPTKPEEPTPPTPTPGAAPPRGGIELRLSLEEAIQWAMEKNLNLEVEKLSSAIAARDLIIARATFDPFFNLSATYAKNRDPSGNVLDFDPLTGLTALQVNPSDIASFRGGVRGLTPIGTSYQVSLVETRFNTPEAGVFVLNPRYSSTAEFTATQPLLKNGWLAMNLANVRTAQNNIQLAREQFELVAVNTVFAVAAAYWDFVFALKNFDSKAKALAVGLQELRNERKRVEVGTRAPIDVTTAESQVARRQTEYDRAAALRDDAQDQLLDRMNYAGTEESLKGRWERRGVQSGFEKYGDLLVIPTSEPKPEPVAVDRSEAIRSAFEQRVEYRQIAIQIANQEIAIKVAKNQLLPALDLTATWSQLGLDETLYRSIDQVFNGDFYDWSVGAIFEIPLSLRGPRAQLRNAIDLKQRLLVQKQSLENAIVLEVDKAIRDLQYTYMAAENYRQQAVLQEELLRAERVRLDVGRSIPYTVAQIENDLVAIQALELRAKADYEIARWSLQRALGELLRRWRLDIAR